ncbi:MAG: hypothetical protein KBT22_04810, partial [Bacteroidales bacterium]|nr:hypothetical protein [Candidatus Scybalocola fimicaballi]
MIDHPCIKYAVALFDKKYDEISNQDLIKELNQSLEKITLEASQLPIGGKYIYTQTSKLPNKNLNIIPASYVLSPDFEKLCEEVSKVIRLLQENKNKKCEIKQSVLPISKEYVRFSDKGGSKTNASVLTKDYALLILTTLTDKKPCISVFEDKSWAQVCVLPDMSLDQTRCFISVFERLKEQKCKDLMEADVKKGEKQEQCKPKIYNGNFPNSVRSTALKILSVLGAIGEIEKDLSSNAERALEGIRDNPMLIISSNGRAKTIAVNNHIINIAQEGKLHIIIDSLYYSKFYMYKGFGRQDYTKLKSYDIKKEEFDIKYETYDYYLSNFLTLFNHHSFAEFLAYRMEYPITVRCLFNKYFMSMENVSREIINSAEVLGSWLNSVAYLVAKKEIAPQVDWSSLNEDQKVKLTEKKYKFLVEMESSVFSASDSISLISHTIARAGRLSNSDAPSESLVFIKAAMNGDISVDVTKNLLIAFSRIKSNKTSESSQPID